MPRKLRSDFAALLAMTVSAAMPGAALADEGGVSFWLPGNYGSLAAVPGQPGWSFASVYYHTSVSAGGSRTFRIGGGVQAGLKGYADLVFLNGTYVSPTPFLGGQFSFDMTEAVGASNAGVNATLTGPLGNTLSGSRSDNVSGFSDLYPRATVKWNEGVHNFMVYTMWGLPVGAYDPNRLANIGIGHWSGDGGAGYTYFDPKTGHEFSAVAGLTYNFKNPYTNYQNGVDFHLDWAASQFLSKEWLVGVVGYFYNQISADSGAGATLGAFESRVAGIGPQVGYLFPAGDMQGYLNLKGYYEFDADHRPKGWNVWLTLAISPLPPTTAAQHQMATRAR
ncbi:MAG: SphA family protein [Pseudolabrys sp.]|jgi:hypothetical protein